MRLKMVARKSMKPEAKACETYCEGYKQFLDAGKTERECAREAVAQAEKLGFRPFVRGEKLKAGDKVYRVNRDRGVILAVIGTESLKRVCRSPVPIRCTSSGSEALSRTMTVSWLI